MSAATTRHAERVLNVGPGPPDDGKARRVDTCPSCGGERWEILVVPDVFHCDACKKATVGPNTEAPADPQPEQIDLFGFVSAPADAVAKSEPSIEEGPPVDEADAWMADEMPDE
jgi:hypothetical protein